MSIASAYKTIYRREVETEANNLIHKYAPVTDVYVFQPLSHYCENCGDNCADNCHKRLGALMRKNLVFYCYGEDEVIQWEAKGWLNDLENAALRAYKKRLPNRPSKMDGLPSEVLLDLLIQVHEPNAYKLAVRPLFRQNDNNEIKGYDLTYFSVSDGTVSLWLGQAKMGQKDYCKRGINEDLLTKFSVEYLSAQMYFIMDKPAKVTEEEKLISGVINQVNEIPMNLSDSDRANALIQCFRNNDITVNIPCLLAYGDGSVYSDIANVSAAIDTEIANMQNHFLSKGYVFNGFTPNIIFYVFPLKDLEKLRSNGGFYFGLR